MNSRTQNILFLAILLAGCNTFGTPEFTGAKDTGATSDTGVTDAATDKLDSGADTGSDAGDDSGDDAGLDAGEMTDLGSDAGDDADMGTATIWTAGEAQYPVLSAFEVGGIAPCNDSPIDVTTNPRLPAEVEFLTVIHGNSSAINDETMVFAQVLASGHLSIDTIDVAPAMENANATTEQIYEGDWSVRSGANQLSAAALRNQLVVAAINDEGDVVVVQCSFAEERACREFETMIATDLVEVGTRGQSFQFYVAQSLVETFILESVLSLDSQMMDATLPMEVTAPSAPVDSLDFGWIATGVPGLVYGADNTYSFMTFDGGNGWVEAAVVNPPTLGVNLPRAEILHESEEVWAVVEDEMSAGASVFRARYTVPPPTWNWETEPVSPIQFEEYDFAPLTGGGVLELKVRNDIIAVQIADKVNSAVAPETPALGVRAPARITAAEGIVGVANYNAVPNVRLLCIQRN